MFSDFTRKLYGCFRNLRPPEGRAYVAEMLNFRSLSPTAANTSKIIVVVNIVKDRLWRAGSPFRGRVLNPPP